MKIIKGTKGEVTRIQNNLIAANDTIKNYVNEKGESVGEIKGLTLTLEELQDSLKVEKMKPPITIVKYKTIIKEKIVEGRIQKRLKEMVLLDQAFIRDTNITIDELIKQNIAKLGENIRIRRFERFNLGEGLEKREDNFQDEVAKMVNG